MAMRPLSYAEVVPGAGAFVSMSSSRVDVTGNGVRFDIPTTYFDFSTGYLNPRIYVFYCPSGGIVPAESEPLNYAGYPLPNYGHRIFSIFDSSTNVTGGPGVIEDDHWAPGWHVYCEFWDPLSGSIPNRYFYWNYTNSTTFSQFIDYAFCYFSPMNINGGATGYLSRPDVGATSVVQPPAQGTNQRTNNSPGGAWNEAGTTVQPTRGVENDTTWAREFFFMANYLFDPNGNIEPYNPQKGIHDVVSPELAPWSFGGQLTVKPRYGGQNYEANQALWNQPMPHGVVMSVRAREIPKIGPAPYRERVIQPIQPGYNSSSLSLVVKGGNFGPTHIQAM